MRPRGHFFAVLLLLFVSCAGSRNYHKVDDPTTSGAPRFLELSHSAQVATLHFPAGTYVLEAADDAGWFYRAPQQIRENSSTASILHDGGIYVKKGRRGGLRGYVYWYGGLVHVGDLSHADYFLRN